MPISVSFYIFLQLINFNFSLLNLFSDATFKIADKVKRRKKNESIIETTNFKQTLIISTKTTKRDENNRVFTQTVPKAYVHMDSKKAADYETVLNELLEIHKDYSDENSVPTPGKLLFSLFYSKIFRTNFKLIF